MNGIQASALAAGAAALAVSIYSGQTWAIGMCAFAFGVNCALCWVACDLSRR